MVDSVRSRSLEVCFLFEGLKRVSKVLNVSGPEMRATAMAPAPGAVEIAQIVSSRYKDAIGHKNIK